MYNISQEFNEAIINWHNPQSLFLVFDYFYLSSVDGEFSGATTIYDSVSDEENLYFGKCPSKHFSCTVNNVNDIAQSVYGKAKMYIALCNSSEQISPWTKPIAHIVYWSETRNNIDDYAFEVKNDGLYYSAVFNSPTQPVIIPETKVLNGTFNGIYVKDDELYIYSLGGSKKCHLTEDMTAPSFTNWTPNAVMTRKLSTDMVMIMRTSKIPSTKNGDFCTFYEEKNGIHYDFGNYTDNTNACPMGVFNVRKPSSTQGIAVQFDDCYDDMKSLDVDGSFVVETVIGENGNTLLNIVQGICTMYNIPCAVTSFLHDDQIIRKSNIDTMRISVRQILSYIAERAMSLFYINRDGALDIKWFNYNDSPETAVATIPETQIVMGGIQLDDEQVEEIQNVIVARTNGDTERFEDYTTQDDYVINGNPLIETANSELFVEVRDGMPKGYRPMIVRLTEANPCIDTCDTVKVSDYYIPLATQTIVWNGKTMATYKAVGSTHREEQSGAMLNYNSKVMTNGYAIRNVLRKSGTDFKHIESGYIPDDGTLSVNPNSYVEYTVTFENPFENIRAVLLTLQADTTGYEDYAHITPVVYEKSLSNFTLRLYAGNMTSGRSPGLFWIAVGD